MQSLVLKFNDLEQERSTLKQWNSVFKKRYCHRRRRCLSSLIMSLVQANNLQLQYFYNVSGRHLCFTVNNWFTGDVWRARNNCQSCSTRAECSPDWPSVSYLDIRKAEAWTNCLWHIIAINQRHATPRRLNSTYLFRTMLGFFNHAIRKHGIIFAKIWNQLEGIPG